MNLSKISVKRPVTTVMVVLIAVCFGLFSVLNMSMDMLPNMNIPIVMVMSTYSGAGPEEMEELVTEPLEENLASVSGLDTMMSISQEGLSVVVMQFDFDVDVDVAAQDVREKAEMAQFSLPEDASDPTVMKMDINSMTGSVVLGVQQQGKDIDAIASFVEDEITPRLERLSGVASVTVLGGRATEIQVVLDQEKMRAHGISEQAVVGTLAAENANTPLGEIYKGDKSLTLRTKSEFKSVDEIRDIIISNSSGGKVFLSDIAEINQVLEDVSSIVYTNGEPSVMLMISKNSTANTVDMSKDVFEEIAKILAENPDLQFTTLSDPAEYINTSLGSVVDSAVKGAIFAVLVLFLFLRNLRSTFIIGVSMPVSIITTFAVMNLCDVNFNIMSLGGLALGIGMLVDNSIVVLESIFKHMEDGEEKFHACVEGSREVANSVVASTLTTVVVFLPITMSGGMVAQMFNDMSLTVVFALFSSLAVALFFVPMACSVLLSPEDVNKKTVRVGFVNKILDLVGGALDAVARGYKRLLDVALDKRRLVIFITVVMLLITGIVIPNMNFEFMPETDEGMVSVSVTLPTGTRIEKTEEVLWEVVERIENVPGVSEEIEDLLFFAGSGGQASMMTGASDYSATIYLTLKGKDEGRVHSSNEVAYELRKVVSDIAGAEIEVTASSQSMGSYSSSGVSVTITGEETEVLKQISDDLVEQLKGFNGISDIASSFEDSSPTTTVRIDRSKANAYGISPSSIASTLRTNITGSTATTFKIDGEEWDVKVMLDSSDVNYITDVNSMLIPLGNGTSVPLAEIATFEDEEGLTSIYREDQKRYVTIEGNLNGIPLTEANKIVQGVFDAYPFPEGYEWTFGGSTEQMNETFVSLIYAILAAVLLVYMIMAAEFERFSFPFVVMFSIPIAMTGGLFGVFLTGQSVNVTSMLGLVMLSGVVVNNAIVLIDYANLLVDERGMTPYEAIKTAGPVRLRPILMTTLTTVLAMVPMMFTRQEGSEMMRGLATSFVSGLCFSTVVTLVLIPCVYVILCNRQNKAKERKALKKAQKASM